MRYLWLTLGLISVAVGVTAIFLPLLPTTPFLLMASYAFARSSERFHSWIMEHPQLGPPIHNWHNERAVQRGTKWAASGSIALAFAISITFGLATWILVAQVITFSCVVVYIWSRPEPAA